MALFQAREKFFVSSQTKSPLGPVQEFHPQRSKQSDGTCSHLLHLLNFKTKCKQVFVKKKAFCIHKIITENVQLIMFPLKAASRLILNSPSGAINVNIALVIFYCVFIIGFNKTLN